MLIDCHVHLVGNGLHNSGCALKLKKPYHKLLAHFMVKSLGLPRADIEGELEEHYLDRLTEFLSHSSLSHLVLLAHEMTYSDSGQALPEFGSLYVPNSYLLECCKKNPQFLPGVSIHPVRPDAIEELERCKAQGAVLMKCLPNVQNIDCANPRYKNFWLKMAELKMPLLAHTGGELALPVFNHKLADPNILRLPLECGVTVIAAHCGTSSHYLDPNYLDTFMAMLKQYPNLYGDNSGLLTPIRSRHLGALIDPAKDGRIIHGSDIPIPVQGRWLAWRGLVSKKVGQEWDKNTNPIERDFQLKLAMGFPKGCAEILSELITRA